VDRAGLAASKKNAARLRAALVFLDESGLLMAPLVRRCWSLRGHTPLLTQRTRGHQKVSAIAALCVAPSRDRIALYFRLLPDAKVNSERVMDFLEHLQHQLRSPIVLIWDRFKAHLGQLIDECTPAQSPHLAYLPPYAPELNPVEYVWSYLKTNQLANAPAFDLPTLAHQARRAVRSVQHQPRLLPAFLSHTHRPLRLN
jgi:putative transposase